jgi:SAM-dependent methyltransferase
MLKILRQKAADLRDRLRGRDDFDAALGVDTSGIVRVVDTKSPNRIHGIRYQPCNPGYLRQAIESASVDLKDFSFVDIGCGKGRALVVAAQYPFRWVIGVDYSLPFIETARNNLLRIGVDEGRFELHWQDATEFRFSPQATFLFLFNPFKAFHILDAVLLHLKEDVLDRGHPVVVTYQGPKPEELLRAGWLLRINQHFTTSLFIPRSW